MNKKFDKIGKNKVKWEKINNIILKEILENLVFKIDFFIYGKILFKVDFSITKYIKSF